MTASEIHTRLLRLEQRMTEQLEAIEAFKELLLTLRQTDIMRVSAADKALKLERTIPKHEHRRPQQ